jgi:hypothetical protein
MREITVGKTGSTGCQSVIVLGLCPFDYFPPRRHVERLVQLHERLEPAFEFKRITNARVPEHAPFFVIGLWLIAKSTRNEAPLPVGC